MGSPVLFSRPATADAVLSALLFVATGWLAWRETPAEATPFVVYAGDGSVDLRDSLLISLLKCGVIYGLWFHFLSRITMYVILSPQDSIFARWGLTMHEGGMREEQIDMTAVDCIAWIH